MYALHPLAQGARLGAAVEAADAGTVYVAGDEADARFARFGDRLQPLYESLALAQMAASVPVIHYVVQQVRVAEPARMPWGKDIKRETRNVVMITVFITVQACPAFGVCRQAAVKGCQNPTPCRAPQIQARPNQPWARCSVFVPPPASRAYTCYACCNR